MDRTHSRLVLGVWPIALALLAACQAGAPPPPVTPGVHLTPPVVGEPPVPAPPSMVPGVRLRPPPVADGPAPAASQPTPGVHLRPPPVVDGPAAPAPAR